VFEQKKKTIYWSFSPRMNTLVTLFPVAVCAGLLTASVGAAASQSQSSALAASGLSTLPGHVHSFARQQFDAGEAPNSLHMSSLELIMAKTPAQQQALDKLVADQENPKSPQYHRFLTPADYGSQFGASEASIAVLSSWLRSNGLQMGPVPAGRAHLSFAGNKAEIEAAFHTQIHLFNVNGESHYANVSDPMIPVALKPMIAAVRGLNDFYPKSAAMPMNADPRGAARALASPDTFYSGSGQYPGYVGPTDFATIYNLSPAYQEGITGAGVTVAIAAESDIDASVLTTFWTAFGVAGSSFGLPAQQFTSMPVPTAAGGVDPGQTMNSNEDEAYLDTEIVGALAPGAKLVLVRDRSVLNAAQYIVDQNLAAVLNVSFGECEGAEGGFNTSINALWEQAVAQGITVTVSTGDAGVATCTAQADIGKPKDVNSNGFAVNGIASTPYDLAVGGTDFDPTMESQYWSPGNQPGTRASALSHIPEIVWNDSCANPIIADAFQVFDPIAFCNTATLPGGTTANPFIQISGGGAGVSSCTVTDSAGNCTGGYAQPAWQVGFGVGSFGGRSVPDVSMIATRWLICSYDTNPCDPTQTPTFPPAATGKIKILQGTSAAAPAVAAIIALLDQTQITPALLDGRQGLVNPMLYQMALPEYQNPAIAGQCNASQGTPSVSLCVFYDVTAGSNAQPCSVANYAASASGSLPASTCVSESSDSTGIIEVSGTPQYQAFPGLDIASGLGSINAAALIGSTQSLTAPNGLAASASGQTVTLTWTADASATVGYDIYQGLTPGAVSLTPIQRNVTGTSTTVSGLQLGQSYEFAIAAVSSIGVSPVSSPAQVTLAPAAPAGLNVSSAGEGAVTLTWIADIGSVVYSASVATSTGGVGAPSHLSIIGTSTTFSNLNPGQEYLFSVEAGGPGGSSTPAQAEGTVVATVPVGLVATAGNGTVSLTWSASLGATSYNVYEGTSSGGEGTVPVQTGLSGASATVSGLNNGASYFFTVAAVDAGGPSPVSNQASATPSAPGSGGGGSADWLTVGFLALLAGSQAACRRSRNDLI
jgi:subtilase family serine protease